MTERIAVVGLGYVGLPVVVGLARHFDGVVGFDIKAQRMAALRDGVDVTREFMTGELADVELHYTDDATTLADRTFYIVTVPTPIDGNRQPELGPLRGVCRLIGEHLKPGAMVVFESIVYLRATEEVGGPILAEASGLRQRDDFKLGYSHERINPGDRTHRLESVVKVIAAEDAATLERAEAIYASVILAGLHKAPSITVAEAAKVIENTQRDLNITLMNELALIFDRRGIRTKNVLEAAGTKWNFLPFTPGLVGGHYIGVDPYYLTAKAKSVGYHPQVILPGRRINDGMGAYTAPGAARIWRFSSSSRRSSLASRSKFSTTAGCSATSPMSTISSRVFGR